MKEALNQRIFMHIPMASYYFYRNWIHAGDQANETLLYEILDDAAQFDGYDIIIDDGGHTSDQMLSSIKVPPQSKQPLAKV